MAGLGEVGHGMAGAAGLGWDWRGPDRHGMAWQAWRGKAGLGAARRGMDRQARHG